MRKILPAALAISTVLVAASVYPADARCFRVGHHSSCFHHRVHFARHAGFRSAAGYHYAYPSYGLGYGYYGSSYSSAATMGPSPRGGGGP